MDMQKERAEFESVFPCSVGTNLNEHGHYESQINQQDAMIQNISWVVWQAAKAKAQAQWISVNDELPPIGETVLICWDDGPDVEPEKDFLDIDEDLNEFWANYHFDEPTHWMPITRPKNTGARP